MEPVDPMIEMGLGPFQFLVPGGTTAVPGQAGGGGAAAEQLIPFPNGTFLLKENPPTKHPMTQINHAQQPKTIKCHNQDCIIKRNLKMDSFG